MHKYQKRLNAALSKGIIDKGSAAHAFISHDDWCGIYSRTECNCNPDILIHTNKGTVKVMIDELLEKSNLNECC